MYDWEVGCSWEQWKLFGQYNIGFSADTFRGLLWPGSWNLFVHSAPNITYVTPRKISLDIYTHCLSLFVNIFITIPYLLNTHVTASEGKPCNMCKLSDMGFLCSAGTPLIDAIWTKHFATSSLFPHRDWKYDYYFRYDGCINVTENDPFITIYVGSCSM